MLSYNAALSCLMHYEYRYSSVLDLVGANKGEGDLVFNATRMRVQVRPTMTDEGELQRPEGTNKGKGEAKPNSWELTCRDPSGFIEDMGFQLLREHSFSYTIIFYIVAQALQALRGCDKTLCLLVGGIL